jgi:DNA-binding transcriptional MerR regulator
MKNVTLMLAILSTLLVSASAFARNFRARRMMERMETEAKREGTRSLRYSRESRQRSFEREVVSKLRTNEGISGRDMNLNAIRDYIKANGETPANVEAMESLLANITANGNVSIAAQKATAELLAEIIVLGKRERFSLEARDILEIDQNWSVTERANLIDVIREAREIANENPSLSPDKAFEQALANRGLLKRFKRRCK